MPVRTASAAPAIIYQPRGDDGRVHQATAAGVAEHPARTGDELHDPWSLGGDRPAELGHRQVRHPTAARGRLGLREPDTSHLRVEAHQPLSPSTCSTRATFTLTLISGPRRRERRRRRRRPTRLALPWEEPGDAFDQRHGDPEALHGLRQLAADGAAAEDGERGGARSSSNTDSLVR
jgi:hypothetical protein